MPALQYESFVLAPFSYITGIKNLSKNDDPKRLGSTDIFEMGSLKEVKMGVYYSIETYDFIFRNYDWYENTFLESIDECAMYPYYKKINAASSKEEITVIITEFLHEFKIEYLINPK